MDKANLKEILERHRMWLETQTQGKQAILSGMDLRGADLAGANLRWAELYGTNLCEANLMGTILYRVDLRKAKLRKAELSGAILTGADLLGADLRSAILRWADLRGANLTKADLGKADLHKADLRGAKLRKANLTGANLDCSCWPLCCESKKTQVDKNIFVRLAWHLCAVEVEDKECKAAQAALNKLTQGFISPKRRTSSEQGRDGRSAETAQAVANNPGTRKTSNPA